MPEFEKYLDKISDKIGNINLKKKRVYFDVKPENIISVAKYLFNDIGCRLSTATAQEVYHGIEVLYHFSNDASGDYFCPRILMIDKNNPHMPSITPVVKGAEWIEREMAEYWGITFDGHPRPEALLTRKNPKGEGLGQPFRIRRITHEN